MDSHGEPDTQELVRVLVGGRDPLTVILGNLELVLRDRQLNDGARERITLVAAQSQLLSEILERALILVDGTWGATDSERR